MNFHPHSSPSRGSALIVALVIAIIIAISLVSYIRLSNNSLKQAHRSFYSNSAMNLAEVGLEEAIACFNQLDNAATPADAWTGWTMNTTPFNAGTSPNTPYTTKNFTGFTPGPNATASVKVYVHYYDGTTGVLPAVPAAPVIVAKSSIMQPDGSPPISKYIEVTLRKRSLFANGLVARENVSWVGHPSADSWDSDPENDGTHVPYDPSLRTANVVVASVGGNIGLASGEVWGYTKTGEFGTSTGGSVHPLGTTTNDPTRRTNDFNATFPLITNDPITNPNTISTNITTAKTFPLPAPDNKTQMYKGKLSYVYVFNSGTKIDLAGPDILHIADNTNVVIIMNNHSGAECISTGGNAGIEVNTGATLNVYTNGDVKIAGNGMVNDNNDPAATMFWGTNSGSQTFDIKGNGQLTATVYAPNAAVTLDGGGTAGLMCGAVVGKTITMNGGTEFHYDDALSRLTTGNPYGISKWRELQSASERQAYAAQLGY